MGEEQKNQVNMPMKSLMNDLGLSSEDELNYSFENIFKDGASPMLFLTKVSNVYSQSHHFESENIELKGKVSDLEKQLKDAVSQVIALQKTEIVLKKDNEYLSTKKQNSIPGTILFAIGSLFIGVCGGFINAKSYPYAVVSGIVGIMFSIFASSLINASDVKEKK